MLSVLQVSNSNTECTVQTFDATHFIWEKEARALKSEAEPNVGTGSTEEEISPKSSNLDLLEHSSSVPSNQEIGEEILEEAHSKLN